MNHRVRRGFYQGQELSRIVRCPHSPEGGFIIISLSLYCKLGDELSPYLGNRQAEKLVYFVSKVFKGAEACNQ